MLDQASPLWSGTCLDGNGRRYVGAFGGSFARMLLGEVFAG